MCIIKFEKQISNNDDDKLFIGKLKQETYNKII